MKRFVCVIALLVSSSANAEGLDEQSLQTLFTSPSERQSMNAARQPGQLSDGYVSGPSNLKVKGIMKRGNGKSVVWINNKNTLDNAMVDGVKVYPDSVKNNNKIPVRADGDLIHVKPGESWSKETGVIEESYQR